MPIWKASDQHVINDRMLIDIQYAHVGNNFTLTFQDPAQRDVQPRFDVTSGVWARSFDESIFKRPTHSIDATISYFLPATLGGDHAFKVGYRWRTARGETIAHTGGNAQARYANVAGTNPNCAPRVNDAGAASTTATPISSVTATPTTTWAPTRSTCRTRSR